MLIRKLMPAKGFYDTTLAMFPSSSSFTVTYFRVHSTFVFILLYNCLNYRYQKQLKPLCETHDCIKDITT